MVDLMEKMQSKLKKTDKINPFSKRTVQIVGSCSKFINSELNEFSHEVVRNLTNGLLENEAIMLSTVGGDALVDNGLPLIYNWDILETVYEYAKTLNFPDKSKNIAKIVSSKKSESNISDNRKQLWENLRTKEIASIKRIKSGKGWNAGAHQRQEQEKLSDALVILGGGEGAEHLFSLYISNGKPVIPLNIPLGSSYSDGISKKESAGIVLYDQAVDNPKKFIPNADETTTAKLIGLNYDNWKNDPKGYAIEVINFLKQYIKPQVFYVRLLNEDHKEYPHVETFFRDTVDHVVKLKNYRIKDMGSSGAQEIFLNLEIFKEINNSAIIIADSTGLRPNCFIETGFAFGLKKRIILTAKKGTEVPFDVNAIDCHFWDPGSKLTIQEKRKIFFEFWDQNVDKPPIVPEVEL